MIKNLKIKIQTNKKYKEQTKLYIKKFDFKKIPIHRDTYNKYKSPNRKKNPIKKKSYPFIHN